MYLCDIYIYSHTYIYEGVGALRRFPLKLHRMGMKICWGQYFWTFGETMSSRWA